MARDSGDSKVVMMAAAHAKTVVEVVTEAEADIGNNRGSSGGVDGDGGC